MKIGKVTAEKVEITEIQGDQYNAGRDINFSTVQNQTDFIKELKNLQKELNDAVEKKVFDEKSAINIDSETKQLILYAKEPQPQKGVLLERLNNLKSLVGGSVSSGLTRAAAIALLIEQAIEKVFELFS